MKTVQCSSVNYDHIKEDVANDIINRFYLLSNDAVNLKQLDYDDLTRMFAVQVNAEYIFGNPAEYYYNKHLKNLSKCIELVSNYDSDKFLSHYGLDLPFIIKNKIFECIKYKSKLVEIFEYRQDKIINDIKNSLENSDFSTFYPLFLSLIQNIEWFILLIPINFNKHIHTIEYFEICNAVLRIREKYILATSMVFVKSSTEYYNEIYKADITDDYIPEWGGGYDYDSEQYIEFFNRPELDEKLEQLKSFPDFLTYIDSDNEI